jgi:hypothetical protein
MKNLFKNNLLLKTILVISTAATTTWAKPLTETNLSQVFASGSSAVTSADKAQNIMRPGLYVIGDEENKLTGFSYLVVDKYANNDEEFLAVMMSKKDQSMGDSGYGRFYIGKSIKGGASVMFSPLFIDVNGNIASQAEQRRDAEVLIVSLKSSVDKYRYPFMIQGLNGALDGQLLGMRYSSETNPEMKAWPSQNIFQGSSSRDNLVISGRTLSVHNGHGSEQTFEIQSVNGEQGKFAQLVSTKFDTMTEEMNSDTTVQKLVFFMKNSQGKEVMIMATPSSKVGEYRFDFYGPQRRTFTDYFLGGKM